MGGREEGELIFVLNHQMCVPYLCLCEVTYVHVVWESAGDLEFVCTGAKMPLDLEIFSAFFEFFFIF